MSSSSFLTELYDSGHWPMSFLFPASGEVCCWAVFRFLCLSSHPPCCFPWFSFAICFCALYNTLCFQTSISFQTFFVQAFKIDVDSWQFIVLLLYILWDDWPIFMISGSNQQLQQQLEYTLLKPDCHSWWISKMQSGCKDTLEEQYTIKMSFKLGKNATEMYRMLQTVVGASCMNWLVWFGFFV